MFISELRDALTNHLREKVRNGVITERALARLIGMSQPHLHNVLKGTRTLGTEMIDRCLYQLRLSVLDLVERSTMTAYLDRDQREIATYSHLPLLAGRLGPVYPWPTEVDQQERIAVAEHQIRDMWHPVAARTAFDARMSATFSDGDFVVLDQSVRARLDFSEESLYVLKYESAGVIRRLRRVDDTVYVIADDVLNSPELWERLDGNDSQLLALVRARVTLITRDQEWSPRVPHNQQTATCRCVSLPGRASHVVC
jgi:hypothetical protein